MAIRRLKKPATPAAAPTGPSATGSHIILLPKLALSCSKKISAAVTNAPVGKPRTVRAAGAGCWCLGARGCGSAVRRRGQQAAPQVVQRAAEEAGDLHLRDAEPPADFVLGVM